MQRNQCDTHMNKMKDKNHMIISIDAEKNSQDSILIYDQKKKKNFPESGLRRNLPHIIKAIHDKWNSLAANIILHVKKLKTFSLRSRSRQRCPLLPLSFSIVWEVLDTVIRVEKEIKGIQIEKEAKLLLFVDDMKLYIVNPKDAARKLLEVMNEFGKVAGYKISTQKSLAISIH